MPECRLISYMVPDGPPFYALGSCHAVTKCETHGWTFEGNASDMCPIGRIEDATNKAIARIKEAANG